MSDPASFSSLRDLRKGSKGPSKGYVGPKVGWSGARREDEPARSNSNSVPPTDYSYSNSNANSHSNPQTQHHTPAYREPREHTTTSFSSLQKKSQGSSHGAHAAPAASGSHGWFSKGEKKVEATSSGRRYIPPSEREPGQDMFSGRPKQRKTGGDESEDDEHAPAESWGEWFAEKQKTVTTAINGAAVTVNDSVQTGWENVNDSQKRDKVVGGIGTGAAKVAGGAIKYSAKGIWAVGKAAMR